MSGALLTAIPRYVQLSRSQWWSLGHLEAYRKKQVEQTLRAAASIPFYAQRFGDRYRNADLGGLPVLRRTDVAELNRSVRGHVERRDRALPDILLVHRPLAACRAALIATLLPDPGNLEERRTLRCGICP